MRRLSHGGEVARSSCGTKGAEHGRRAIYRADPVSIMIFQQLKTRFRFFDCQQYIDGSRRR